MPTFVMVCVDKPDSLPLRMATRKAHLDYVAGLGTTVRLGGPLQNDMGDMAGSLLIVEADDLAAARAVNANDPYQLAGLFDRVELHPVRITLGALA